MSLMVQFLYATDVHNTAQNSYDFPFYRRFRHVIIAEMLSIGGERRELVQWSGIFTMTFLIPTALFPRRWPYVKLL